MNTAPEGVISFARPIPGLRVRLEISAVIRADVYMSTSTHDPPRAHDLHVARQPPFVWTESSRVQRLRGSEMRVGTGAQEGVEDGRSEVVERW